jgi:hypothetical protein
MQRNLFGDYFAVYGLEDIRSCAPLTNPDFMYLLEHFPGMKVSAVWITRVLNPVAAQPLLNMLNVKYLLCSPTNAAAVSGGVYPITRRGGFLVLENPGVWPRAFFADRIDSISSVDEFISHLRTNTQPFVAMTPDDIGKQAGLSELQAAPGGAVTPATHYQLLPNSTGFDIHAGSAGVVCLTEGQGRDFTATANGADKPVLAVNRAFKGIYLDKPGDYHVEFTYRPHHWKLACTLFWLAVQKDRRIAKS